MTAGTYNIVIEQGADFALSLAVTDSIGTIRDLTGYTARMQARENFASSTKILDLTTANGKIAINGPLGEISITLTDTETAAITATQGIYDLEIIAPAPGSLVERLLQGSIIFSKEVTK